MSTLKTVNIQHPSSASVNAGTDTSGNFLMNSGYGSVATAYGCRAWVNFNGQGTVAIRASGNVTSITDNGTGDYTVNFATAMPDVDYCANVSAGNSGGSRGSSVNAYSASSIRVNTWAATTGTLTDFSDVNVAVFR